MKHLYLCAVLAGLALAAAAGEKATKWCVVRTPDSVNAGEDLVIRVAYTNIANPVTVFADLHYNNVNGRWAGKLARGGTYGKIQGSGVVEVRLAVPRKPAADVAAVLGARPSFTGMPAPLATASRRRSSSASARRDRRARTRRWRSCGATPRRRPPPSRPRRRTTTSTTSASSPGARRGSPTPPSACSSAARPTATPPCRRSPKCRSGAPTPATSTRTSACSGSTPAAPTWRATPATPRARRPATTTRCSSTARGWARTASTGSTAASRTRTCPIRSGRPRAWRRCTSNPPTPTRNEGVEEPRGHELALETDGAVPAANFLVVLVPAAAADEPTDVKLLSADAKAVRFTLTTTGAKPRTVTLDLAWQAPAGGPAAPGKGPLKVE